MVCLLMLFGGLQNPPQRHEFQRVEITSPIKNAKYLILVMSKKGDLLAQTGSLGRPEAFLRTAGRWTKLPSINNQLQYMSIVSLSEDDTALITASRATDIGVVTAYAYTVFRHKALAIPRQRMEAKPSSGAALSHGGAVWFDSGMNGSPQGSQQPVMFLSQEKSDAPLGIGENPHANRRDMICFTVPNVNPDVIEAMSSSPKPQAMVWRHGKRIALGPGVAADINSNGQVLGYLSASYERLLQPIGKTMCWIYSNGHVKSLGSLGPGNAIPTSINDRGDFVGTHGVNENEPFLYQRGKIYNLNEISKGPGPALTGAESIDNKGEILCYSKDDSGHTRYFLLRPGTK